MVSGGFNGNAGSPPVKLYLSDMTVRGGLVAHDTPSVGGIHGEP